MIKMIKKILQFKYFKYPAAVLAVLVPVFALFYVFFVVPNPMRIKMPDTGMQIDSFDKLSYDFIQKLPEAKVKAPALLEAGALLNKYKFKQTSPYQHTGPLNLHLSLGWFPLKTVHENCIFAPAPCRLEYTAVLGKNPVLKFDYGIISSLDKKLSRPAVFKVSVIDEQEREKTVFEKQENPLLPYRWTSRSAFYKEFYKYLHPDIEDRDSRWSPAIVDLQDFAGQKVRIKFITEEVTCYTDRYSRPSSSENCENGRCVDNTLQVPDTYKCAISTETVLCFWGTPALYNIEMRSNRKNVILLVVDSFRKSDFNAKLTPELYGLADEGFSFDNMFSNGNMTKLSASSFLTSKYPDEIPEISTHYDVSDKDKEFFYSRRLPTLAGEFKKAGYRTAVIGSCSLFQDGMGFSADLGFDEAVNLEHSGYSPPHVTKETIEWLKRHGKENYFIMVYYDGPHGPYRPPLKYILGSMLKGGLFRNFRKILYDGELIYHDVYAGQLKDYLRESGLDKDTVIAVTSDHGVAFRKVVYHWPSLFGRWKKKTIAFHSHGVSLIPEDLNVPFVINDGRHKGASAARCELVDMAPTLLDISGIPAPKEFRGGSLKDVMSGKEENGSLITYHRGWQNRGIYWKDEWLYINNFAPREGFPGETVVPEELYNIKYDPRCAKNLLHIPDLDSSLIAKLRKLMDVFVLEKEMMKLLFIGAKDEKLELKVDSNSDIDELVCEGEPVNKAKRSFTVTLKPGQSVLFSSVDRSAEFAFSVKVNGRQLPSSDILTGKYALPFLSRTVVGPADRESVLGFPEDVELPSGKSALIMGTVKEKAGEKENLMNAPAQLKSMLEQWGYINQ